MFGAHYFAPSYFAPNYFGTEGEDAPAPEGETVTTFDNWVNGRPLASADGQFDHWFAGRPIVAALAAIAEEGEPEIPAGGGGGKRFWWFFRRRR